MPQDLPPTGGYEAVQYRRNIPTRGLKPVWYLVGVGAVMAYGWRQVFVGQREKHEMAREKMWSRIHLTPLLQAEEDRDQVRRYYADLAREKELLGSQSGAYNSDRYAFVHLPVLCFLMRCGPLGGSWSRSGYSAEDGDSTTSEEVFRGQEGEREREEDHEEKHKRSQNNSRRGYANIPCFQPQIRETDIYSHTQQNGGMRRQILILAASRALLSDQAMDNRHPRAASSEQRKSTSHIPKDSRVNEARKRKPYEGMESGHACVG
ncbi:hypothetical protein FOPE_12217 [Fonsecaea pedrosoi]|nr:hypothetical protein FOPE_12217 [Fonsecaea pedrosoi]